MSTSSSDNIVGVEASRVTAGDGASFTAFVDLTAKQNSLLLKAGSTLLIFGTINGSTMAGSTIVAGYSNAFILGANETMSLDGPTRFYTGALGATAIAYLLKGLTGVNQLGS